MKRITKLIYLALGSCLIAGLNASCELVSENYGPFPDLGLSSWSIHMDC